MEVMIGNHTSRLAKYFLFTMLLVSAFSFGGVGNVTAQRETGPKVSGVRRPSGRTAKPPRGQEQITEPRSPRGATTGEKIVTDAPVLRSTTDIMIDQAARGEYTPVRQQLWDKGLLREELELPESDDLPSAPGARPGTQFPALSKSERQRLALQPEVAPQTLSTTFDGATGPSETGAFPPDTMGAVGPTQVVVFLNGRLRTFNKSTGVADGVINADSDVFFASVVSTPGAGEVAFTSDPNVRFDRLSNRWFLSIIDVVLNSTTGATTRVNRILLAVSDAASNGSISGATVWTFYQFTGDATLFTDYPGFGIDANAIYIGGNMFTLAGSFNSTKGWVIPKAPALAGGALTVWAFSGLVASAASAGPIAPRGVDNPDPANVGPTATGYFIGPDNITASTLTMRRITNPGSTGVSPTISANISVSTTISTAAPVKVPHLGNTGGNNGRLDALDVRLYAAIIRNGRLWTAHNIGVNNTGTTTGTRTRNAARWYELQNLSTTPAVRQAGTLYDNSGANDVNQRNYWIPSITVTGQGHAALACTIAGTNERVNAFFTGRLSGDTLGTMRDGPGGTALPGITATSSAYNPPSDAGGSGGRRWGDYSFTSVDPKDDMTVWTIQEYVNGTNTYGVRAAKLLAPPPANIADGAGPSGVYQVLSGQSSINVTIGGLAPAGQGFYDPGPDPAAPHTPFNHITASISGASVTVNSITYNSPTSITLNLNTVGATAGLRNLTITNPDGQAVTRNNVIQIMSPTAAPAPLTGRVTDGAGNGVGFVSINVRSTDGTIDQTATTNPFGYFTFSALDTGLSYVITPARKQYTFDPPNAVYTHQGAFSEMNFTATRAANRSRSRGR